MKRFLLLLAALAPLSAQDPGAFSLLQEQKHAAREDADYRAGTGALDARHFAEAVQRFDAVIARNGAHTDGAYYWKAYALNRLGRRAEARAALTLLEQNFPQSQWRNDAQALEVEVRAQEGHPVNPDAEADEDLKLIALNGLMQSDPDQALPIIEKLLKSNQSPKVKERALFVLSQSASPKARKIVLDFARGASNPDLQLKAIRTIAMAGNESSKDLADIYASSKDTTVKRAIIQSYLMSNSRAELLQVASKETDPALRMDAIRVLSQSGDKEEVWQLYKSESQPNIKREIIRSMIMSGDSQHLLAIIQTEKDPALRREAIQTFGMTGDGDGRVFVDIYRKETDHETKKSLVRALFIKQDAKDLIALAREEKDPVMKKEIIQQLALVHSKETTDYMMEILK